MDIFIVCHIATCTLSACLFPLTIHGYDGVTVEGSSLCSRLPHTSTPLVNCPLTIDHLYCIIVYGLLWFDSVFNSK